MSEDGFGDLVVEHKSSFSLAKLKKVNLPVTPVFMSVQAEAPCNYLEIGNQESCLCDRFNLAGKPVKPLGPKTSPYVFVGRDPGEQEVENGEPFWPEAPGGEILMEYLEKMGLVREEVYITNVCFCRAPGNAPPTPKQVHACASFHKKEFEALTGVKYIFPLGSHAFQVMTGVFGSVTSFVGSYFETNLFGREVKIIPLHHPGYLLRNGSLKDQIFKILEDLGGA